MVNEDKPIKKLFYDLYSGYPNSRIHETAINKIIITEKDRLKLIEQNLLIRETHNNSKNDKDYYNYGLGPAGLMLISTWNVEKLSRNVIFLSALAIIISFSTLAFTIIALNS